MSLKRSRDSSAEEGEVTFENILSEIESNIDEVSKAIKVSFRREILFNAQANRDFIIDSIEKQFEYFKIKFNASLSEEEQIEMIQTLKSKRVAVNLYSDVLLFGQVFIGYKKQIIASQTSKKIEIRISPFLMKIVFNIS